MGIHTHTHTIQSVSTCLPLSLEKGRQERAGTTESDNKRERKNKKKRVEKMTARKAPRFGVMLIILITQGQSVEFARV